MSILIKGMEMPEIDGNREVKAEIRQLDGKLEFGIMTGGYDCCEEWSYYPIQEIQKPHGRLIDAEAFFKDICNSIENMTKLGIGVDADFLWAKLNDALDNAPTVIPADKDGE